MVLWVNIEAPPVKIAKDVIWLNYTSEKFAWLALGELALVRKGDE